MAAKIGYRLQVTSCKLQGSEGIFSCRFTRCWFPVIRKSVTGCRFQKVKYWERCVNESMPRKLETGNRGLILVLTNNKTECGDLGSA